MQLAGHIVANDMTLVAIVWLCHPDPRQSFALRIGEFRATTDGIDERNAFRVSVVLGYVCSPRPTNLKEGEGVVLLEQLTHCVLRFCRITTVAHLNQIDLAPIDASRRVNLVKIELIASQNRCTNYLYRASCVKYSTNCNGIAVDTRHIGYHRCARSATTGRQGEHGGHDNQQRCIPFPCPKPCKKFHVVSLPL